MTSTQQFGRGHAEVPSIPLSPEYPDAPADQSIGELVRDATTHLSTLVRSEIELARSEVVAEVRKGVRGSIYFVIALAIVVFAVLFAFLLVAEILDIWLPRSAAFGIVFVMMLLAAAGFALLGLRRVRSIHAPERTINSMRDNAALAMRRQPDRAGTDDRAQFGSTG